MRPSSSQAETASIELLPTNPTTPQSEPTNNFTLLPPPSRELDALPPIDGGYLAWLAVGACFAVNALVWGFAFAFGVLQEFYGSHEPFANQPGIPAIGTTATGVMYLTMPVFMSMFRKWPQTRRWCMWVSLPAIVAALVAASCAESVATLIVCQGLFYGIAGNGMVMPNVNLVNEWFFERRALAIGISISGDFVGGVVMPLVLQGALDRVGFRWTLRIVALIFLVVAAPLIFIVKSRLPTTKSYIPPPVDSSFLKTRLFWTLQLFNFCQALGYFLPLNYLPTIAESFGLSRTLGSLTILCVNFTAIFGCIAVGALSDRFDVTTVLFSLSMLASASIFSILGNATSVPPLYIFSLMYGLTAAAYSTGWGGIIKELQRRHANTDANLVFGMLAFVKGVGSVISGPLSTVLLQTSKAHVQGPTTYNGQYGPLVIFSGCTAFMGGLAWMVRKTGFI